MSSRKPRPRRVSSALSRIATRALEASPDDIRTYAPTELDLRIAEAMLGGAMLMKDIAEEIGVGPATVSKTLKNPTAAAWISNQVHKMISTRLGHVDAAMMSRALSGNVQAAKLLYERFGEIVHRSQHNVVHTQAEFNPADLTNEQLEAIAGGRVIDADYSLKEEDDVEPSSTGASPAKDPGGADGDADPAPEAERGAPGGSPDDSA